MIKSYVYVNGDVVAKGEKDIEKVVSYCDNIGERFVVQNVIEYLEKQLAKDSKEVESKINDRECRVKNYKKLVPLTGALSVAVPLVLSGISVIGNHPETINIAFGDFSPYTATVVTITPVTIVLGQCLASLELFFRPSKGEIAGYEEMVKYEEETLDEQKNNLAILCGDNRRDNEPTQSNALVVYEVKDESALKRVKDNLKLRYAFGSHRDKIYEMYKTNTLLEAMKEHGFCDDAIADFMIFVQQEYAKNNDESVTLGKKNS